MSIEKEAIELIGQQAIAARGALQGTLPPNTLACPKDFAVVDLQHLQPLKRRFNGKLTTSDIEDYIAYVRDPGLPHDGAPDPSAFIDAENLSCLTFFNLGDANEPGHADWRAELVLKATAPYSALLAVEGKKFSQELLVNWLEDWSDCLSPFSRDDGATYGTISKATQAIRKITIKAKREAESSVEDLGATRSAMEQIEASSKLELPAGFTFTCEPYLGLPQRTFKLRLQVLTGGDVPALSLRTIQLEAQKEAIVRDFKLLLKSQLNDIASLTIGTFKV